MKLSYAAHVIREIEGKNEMANCQELWLELMPQPTQLPGGLLYHYTSLEALKAIVESKCFWATNVRFLNDSSEFQHAYSHTYTDILLDALVPEINSELKAHITDSKNCCRAEQESDEYPRVRRTST